MSEKADFKQLGKSALGVELTLQECEVLARIMGVSTIKDGELLVAENDEDTTLFVLTAGRLDVLSLNEGNEALVYTMSEGECAGTRAFVDRSPRKATLRARGDAEVLTLSPDKFETLLETNPDIVYKVMRALFRITHTNLLRMNQEIDQLSNYISKSKGRY